MREQEKYDPNAIYGYLSPIAIFEGPDKGRRGSRTRFLCVCVCGKIRDYIRKDLINGHTQSCNCKRPGARPRHGEARKGRSSPEYQAWGSMKERCLSSKNPSDIKNYIERGITICDRWLNSYENFLADMGRKPSPQHSLDRINNDGNYEPGNCRWATRSEQVLNSRPRARDKLGRIAPIGENRWQINR
jgi:hypothetical protein